MLRDRIRAGPVYGTIVQSPAPRLVEAVASGGLDFILVDHMHSAISWEAASNMAKLARAADLSAFYRPSGTPGVPGTAAYLAAQCLRALSVGFDGLFVSIADETDADAVCATAEHFWNRGTPSGAPADARRKAREAIFVIAQFESLSALEHLDAVARLPGLDGLAVANSDVTLEVSDGLDANDGRVVSLVEKVRAACDRHDLALWCNTGYGFPGLSDMADRAERLVGLGVDLVLFQSAEFVLLNAFRQLVATPSAAPRVLSAAGAQPRTPLDHAVDAS
jgi:2-keto-3-deoxy-L-rhamnonate aldolase RhmA